jgi:hypothetical protein
VIAVEPNSELIWMFDEVGGVIPANQILVIVGDAGFESATPSL